MHFVVVCVIVLLVQKTSGSKILSLSSRHREMRPLRADMSGIVGLEPPEAMIRDSEAALERESEVEYDYVVIGSGIGGLSSAAMLGAAYGYKVLVLESHYLPGGCAHTFERKTKAGVFKFDAGPSLWNGMATKPYNPLREVMEIVGEGDVQYSHYDGWVMHTPPSSSSGWNGTFKFTVGEGEFEKVVQKYGGPTALQEYTALLKALKPVQELSCAVPPLALRSDLGAIRTLLPHFGGLLKGAPVARLVEGCFADISRKYIKDEFLTNWFEFLSFALSGLPADGTIAAAVAYTMRDMHQKGAQLDYPIGGSGAVVDALLRGCTKNGGKIVYNTHVEAIEIDGATGKAVGVRTRGKGGSDGKTFRAKRAVISNASIWDTLNLLSVGVGAGVGDREKDMGKETETNYSGKQLKLQKKIKATQQKVEKLKEEKMKTPMTGSFVHLHVGIDATGLPADLESHYSVINQWEDIEAPQNHVIISIPSVLDPSMCPPGHHVIHAYAAANEPYEQYEQWAAKDKDKSKEGQRGIDGGRKGEEEREAVATTTAVTAETAVGRKISKEKYEEYKKYKAERCEFLWTAIERSIPDVRSRVVIGPMEGSPLTHARFNRRYKGTYGPRLRAGKEKFPYPKDLGIDNLVMCGDSIFPGIGVPAVAASGANAASSTVSVGEQLKMLEKLYEIQK